MNHLVTLSTQRILDKARRKAEEHYRQQKTRVHFEDSGNDLKITVGNKDAIPQERVQNGQLIMKSVRDKKRDKKIKRDLDAISQS